jgi:hypothetical protein
MQSTYVTWVKVCQHHQIPDKLWRLNGQYNYIEFKDPTTGRFNGKGSRIDLLDLKLTPADPMYERFGSLEYSDGAIEEAGEVNFLAYDVLKSRIGRHMADKVKPTMMITGNPKKNWTYSLFYKPWREGTLPPNIRFIQSLYKDNEYTAEIYGQQLSKISDRATKERLMHGNWEYDDDSNALIPYQNILDLWTNTIPDTDERWMVVDVARYGSDKSVISIWQGLRWIFVETMEKKGTDEVLERIKELLRDYQVPYSHCLIDEDGIGGGVLDHLKGARGFMANRLPFMNRITGKPDNFRNLKTQCSYLLSELVNTHKIAISWRESRLQETLIEELEQLKRKDSEKEGRLEIEPKDIIKENIGRSPDMMDTMVMRMFFEFEHPTKEGTFVNPLTKLLLNPFFGNNGNNTSTSYR